ncbi:hypothetical protein ACXPWS_13180 [Mycobacterium sp. BMJ-28]
MFEVISLAVLIVVCTAAGALLIVTVARRPADATPIGSDPAAAERLVGPTEIAAVRAAFDQMLLGKGLVTDTQLTLIRHGTRAHGVVTASTPTGTTREDYREVVLDLMVRKPEGGQFPAHETTLVPATSLDRLCPGSIVDAYYRRGDESAVAVCVPPG